MAAVLHETRFAETKGSGIRVMRETMEQAGLTPPLFESDRSNDLFVARYFFHNFLGAEDVAWLARFKEAQLSPDEAKALVVVREAGAMDNASYRALNKVDTLSASAALRRLRDAGLLVQKGRGSATYYVPADRLGLGEPVGDAPGDAGLSSQSGGLSANPEGLSSNLGGLSSNPEGLCFAMSLSCRRVLLLPIQPFPQRLLVGARYCDPELLCSRLDFIHQVARQPHCGLLAALCWINSAGLAGAAPHCRNFPENARMPVDSASDANIWPISSPL
jgi:hypothetical protein